MNVKQNWFETLNQSLESEELTEVWPFGVNISYGENCRIVTDNGILISIFRENNGMYERPIHYKIKF